MTNNNNNNNEDKKTMFSIDWARVDAVLLREEEKESIKMREDSRRGSHLLEGLPDTGQFGATVFAERRVIGADDAQLPRHLDAQLFRGLDKRQGIHIRPTDDRRGHLPGLLPSQ